MPARPTRVSAEGRRRIRLVRLEWASVAVAVVAAFAVGALGPATGDAVLIYFLASVIAAIAYGAELRFAFVAIPLALASYYAVLALTMRPVPDSIFAAGALALFCAGAVGTGVAGLLRKEDQSIRFSPLLPNCVGYDIFSQILGKDIARCQRHKLRGALALIHLRNLDVLTKPEAYQQHDLILSRILAALGDTIRRSDTVCYLGDLHFALTFPHTSSDQAWKTLDRVKNALSPLPQRLLPALNAGPLDWEAVCIEYPQDGATTADVLDTAAHTLSEEARLRIQEMEKQKAVVQRQLQKLGYV